MNTIQLTQENKHKYVGFQIIYRLKDRKTYKLDIITDSNIYSGVRITDPERQFVLELESRKNVFVIIN